MKCKVCGDECKGNLTIIDPNILEKMNCCNTCFKLWTHQEYDELSKRIGKYKIKEIKCLFCGYSGGDPKIGTRPISISNNGVAFIVCSKCGEKFTIK